MKINHGEGVGIIIPRHVMLLLIQFTSSLGWNSRGEVLFLFFFSPALPLPNAKKFSSSSFGPPAYRSFAKQLFSSPLFFRVSKKRKLVHKFSRSWGWWILKMETSSTHKGPTNLLCRFSSVSGWNKYRSDGIICKKEECCLLWNGFCRLLPLLGLRKLQLGNCKGPMGCLLTYSEN